jgi:hypothetical protein
VPLIAENADMLVSSYCTKKLEETGITRSAVEGEIAKFKIDRYKPLPLLALSLQGSGQFGTGH